jgi:hypothetical protein
MATNNPVKWSAYTAAKAALFAAGGLKNLANAAFAISASAVDNSAGDQYADLEMLADIATQSTAGGYFSVWFVSALDGSNYESIVSGSITPARSPDVIIPIVSQTGDSQVVTIKRVCWPQGVFKTLVQNNTGQTTTNTDNLTQLSFRSYNDNLVTA